MFLAWVALVSGSELYIKKLVRCYEVGSNALTMCWYFKVRRLFSSLSREMLTFSRLIQHVINGYYLVIYTQMNNTALKLWDSVYNSWHACVVRGNDLHFSDEEPMLETIDYTIIRIGSALTLLQGWCQRGPTAPPPRRGTLAPRLGISPTNCQFTQRGWLQPQIVCKIDFIPSFMLVQLKGKLSQAVNLKKTARTFQVWFKTAMMQGKTDGPLAAKEITPDKRADPVNEKWPENVACCHKRIYLKACSEFPLMTFTFPVQFFRGRDMQYTVTEL